MKHGTTITLTEPRLGLPAGTKITRRQYSWAVETVEQWGYLSCGTTLSKAIRHALSGQPQRALATLQAQAAVIGAAV